MIPVFKPLIEKEELAASTNALELGWLGMGSFVNEFEKALQTFTQSEHKYVAAVSTGHAALHLGLIIAGIGPGDEVITPSFNNIADLQAILATGGEPVFCDIDEDSLCIDLNKAEKLITNKTKAIIVMDYDCILCDHQKVKEISKKYGLRIIHDAAHSFGSKYKGKMIGSFSDITMFSFDPVKTITCIDGGALIVNTKEELEIIHELRLIGMGQPAAMMYENKRAWTYDVKRLGFRYHMANLHGALGLAQLAKMEIISKSRRETAILYSKELKGIRQIITPKSDFKNIVPFLYYIRILGGKREELIKFLKENGIDTGIHWQPAHCFSLFKKAKCGDLSVTNIVGKEILSLPLHSCMKKSDTKEVINAIKTFFKS
ncbi:MAG: DegT/DnrJ/EryC1/StrS aminotransferase family protein [Ginsengibacter sp.]